MFKGKAHFRLIEASWKQLCFLLCQDLSGRGGFCSKDLLTFSTKTFQKKRERERERTRFRPGSRKSKQERADLSGVVFLFWQQKFEKKCQKGNKTLRNVRAHRRSFFLVGELFVPWVLLENVKIKFVDLKSTHFQRLPNVAVCRKHSKSS